MIKDLAKEYNELYFKNELNIEDINFFENNRLYRTRGRFAIRNGKQTIELSPFVLKDENETKQTLVHELIHAWQYQKNQRLGHGSSFKNKSYQIMILSSGELNIKRTSVFENKEIKEQIEKIRNPKEQYLICKGIKNYFIKKLSLNEINLLKEKEYEVFKIKNPTSRITNCRNIEYLLKARYYYSDNVVNNLNLEIEEV